MPSITAVGSAATGSGTSLAVDPTAVGDVLVLWASSQDLAGPAPVTAVSGGGVTTWVELISYMPTYYGVSIWFGRITTSGPGTIAVTTSGSVEELAAQQFSVGTPATWAADGSGASAISGAASGYYPSVTPSASGELYLGAAQLYHEGGGSTAGFVYTNSAPSSSEATQFVYNLSAPSPSAPAWTAVSGGTSWLVSALLAATPQNVYGTATVSLGALSVTARGTFAPLIEGTASVALGALSVQATGVSTALGSATVSIGALSVVATTGTRVVYGTVSVELGALSVVATGAVKGIVYGTAAVTLGALSLTVANALYNDLYRFVTSEGPATAYRIATNLPKNATYVDYTPASGVDYSFYCVAVGPMGSTQGVAQS
jgi:hypothetical protein